MLPEAQQEYWQQLCQEYHFTVEHVIANGGQTRFHSVKNGLALIPDDAEGVVGVHDGVRPFVSVDVISRCYDAARTEEAVIPVTPVVETLRYVGHSPEDNNADSCASPSRNVLRSDYRLVQTPQTFSIALLKRAYALPYTDSFTDDASVVEALGHAVSMVEGNRENIKITTPFDLAVAAALTNE